MRIISPKPNGLKGIELATDDELKEIKPYLAKLNIPYDGNQIFYNLNPKPEESKVLEDKFPEFKAEVQEYGFLSPAVMIIEAYVNFFMTRYEREDPKLRDDAEWQKKLKQQRDGLKAEKAFDLILQGMALPFNYLEPITDWRKGHGAPFPQTSDFYVPALGKLEVKSVTRWSGENRVNVNKAEWFDAAPNYLVALTHIGGKFVMLCGAMRFSEVNSYAGGPFDIATSKPFLSIPLEDLTITAMRLYQVLFDVEIRLDKLDKVQI